MYLLSPAKCQALFLALMCSSEQNNPHWEESRQPPKNISELYDFIDAISAIEENKAEDG